VIQDKIKNIFDKKTKVHDFYIGDKVNGIPKEKKRVNMVNLISYGRALISLMVIDVTMHFS